MSGWIKIHRQVKDKAYYKDSEFIHLWLHLLLCANHANGEYLNGYEIIKLKKGQFVTGRKKLSLETGISESKIERILKVFESEQQIEQQTNSRNRVISIVSWDKYQQTEQQTDNKWTASEQQVDTNNNDKNNKNDKNIKDIYKTTLQDCEKLFIEKTLNNWTEQYAKKEALKFYNFYSAKGWVIGKSKMKSLSHAVGGWISRQDKPELINAPVDRNKTEKMIFY